VVQRRHGRARPGGEANADIAARLGMREGTVKAYGNRTVPNQ
jgi:DNA-binding NarL/FixJ family response regulator